MARGMSILAALVLLLTGCGRGGDVVKAPAVERDAPKKDDLVAKDSPALDAVADGKPKPAPRPVVYSARELAKMLDLSALPTIDGTNFLLKSAAVISAVAPGPMSDVIGFYQKTLAAQGWEKFDPPGSTPPTAEYGSFHFTKDGHVAHLSVSPSTGQDKKPITHVNMQNHGNLDTRTLPRRAATPNAASSQSNSSYFTPNAPSEEAAWIAGELKKEGWEEYGSYYAPLAGVKDNFNRTYRKQGYTLGVYVGATLLEGKPTTVSYMVHALSHELPAPPGAAKLQFSDRAWKMNCEIAGDFKAVGEFYQKAMPAAGYKPLPGEEPQSTYWNLRFGTDADDLVMVQVSSKDGETTKVSVHGLSAAVLAEMKRIEERRQANLNKPKTPKTKPVPPPPPVPEFFANDVPLPKDATNIAYKADRREITFKSKTAIAPLAAQIREQLSEAGWTEEKRIGVVGKATALLSFTKNNATLRVSFLSFNASAGTQATISTSGLGFR